MTRTASVNTLGVLVEDLALRTASLNLARAIRISLRSLWSPVLFTADLWQKSEFLGWPSYNGSNGGVSLNHQVLANVIFDQEEYFNWSSIYSPQLAELESFDGDSFLLDFTQDVSNLIKANVGFWSILDEALSQVYQVLSNSTHGVTSAIGLIYGESSMPAAALRTFLITMSALGLAVAASGILFAITRSACTPLQRRRKIATYAIIIFDVIIAGILLIVAGGVLPGLMLVGDGCQILGVDLLELSHYGKYHFLNSVLPTSIVDSCLAPDASGNLYHAAGIGDDFDAVVGMASSMNDSYRDFVAHSYVIFENSPKSKFPVDFTAAMQAEKYLSLLIPKMTEENSFLWMTDAEFVFSTPFIDDAVPIEELGPQGRVAIRAFIDRAHRQDLHSFPSFNNSYPWLSVSAFYPLRVTTIAFRQLLAEARCIGIASLICTSVDDATCASNFQIGTSTIAMPDFGLMASEMSIRQHWDSHFALLGRTPQMLSLLRCLGASDIVHKVRFMSAVVIVILKEMLLAEGGLERTADSYTMRREVNHFDVCPIGQKCPVFYGMQNPHVYRRGIVSAPTLITASKFNETLKSDIVYAAERTNTQLGTHTMVNLAELNSVTRVWNALLGLSTSYNCTIMRRLLSTTDDIVCHKVGPLFLIAGAIWAALGMSIILFTVILWVLSDSARRPPSWMGDVVF